MTPMSTPRAKESPMEIRRPHRTVLLLREYHDHEYGVPKHAVYSLAVERAE